MNYSNPSRISVSHSNTNLFKLNCTLCRHKVNWSRWNVSMEFTPNAIRTQQNQQIKGHRSLLLIDRKRMLYGVINDSLFFSVFSTGRSKKIIPFQNWIKTWSRVSGVGHKLQYIVQATNTPLSCSIPFTRRVKHGSLKKRSSHLVEQAFSCFSRYTTQAIKWKYGLLELKWFDYFFQEA